MKAFRTAVLAFAFFATTVQGRAAELCALFDDLTALQTAAVQQRLMVSALACNETASYNEFVLGHQGELQKSDQALQSFFTRQNAETGIDDYHGYKTRLANVYSLLSAQHKEEYCNLTRAALERSKKGEAAPLREFILAQPLVLVVASRSCGDPVNGGRFTFLPAKASGAPASVAGQGYDGFGRRGTYRGSDYFFYDGRSLRFLYNLYTDSFGRR
jgi:hypothetical protein